MSCQPLLTGPQRQARRDRRQLFAAGRVLVAESLDEDLPDRGHYDFAAVTNAICA